MRDWRPRLLLSALSCALAFAAGAATKDAAVNENFLPPWNSPPAGLQFSVPPFDAIVDLHGNIVDPQLVMFFAVNQFMVVHDLIAAFKQAHPQYQRVFVKTLPPGILDK